MLANFCSAMQFRLTLELITNSIESQCGGCVALFSDGSHRKFCGQISWDMCHGSRAKYSTQSTRSHSQTVRPSLCRICHFRFDNIIYILVLVKRQMSSSTTFKSSQKNGEAIEDQFGSTYGSKKCLYNLLLCKRYTNKHFRESPFLCRTDL